MSLDDRVLAYYDHGLEKQRLQPGPSLELIRSQILLRRVMPPASAKILDVGGGAGVHAAWLAALGYEVRLIDPVPLHVEQAQMLDGVTAEIGDARVLPVEQERVDVVLALGPLYHLPEDSDRHRALREALRVLVPGGLVAAAAISRYAPMFDGYWRGYAEDPEFVAIMHTDMQTGQHRNPGGKPEWFTTSFMHTPDGLAEEIRQAGFEAVEVLPVEGPLQWAPDLAAHLGDPDRRQALLETLTLLEANPSMHTATAHLLGFGRKPSS